ncbi:MAG TPA: transketolase C-terminal domain-containing protein [Vicinamibacterales bacterium]|jgi:transketolase
MRKAFAETLTRLAEENDRIIFLTGDLGFQTFDEFQRRFGPRYVNVGVAEAQMMSAATGLALEGWRPFVYSIASFATARAFEQVRVGIGYHSLPVVIVGAGGGYLYASSGVTHHAPDDLGLMSLLPGMTVVAPADPVETEALLPQLATLAGPAYIRIGKYGEPRMAAEETPTLGRARLVRRGQRVLVLTTGDMARVAVEALDELSSEEIRPMLYQMHTVKPLDVAALDRLADQVDAVVVAEEHGPVGGLWAGVCHWYATTTGRRPLLRRLGAPDAYVHGSPGREELLRRIRCDATSIADEVRSVWARAPGAGDR